MKKVNLARWSQWLREKKNKIFLAQIVAAMLLPWICVTLYCFLQGRSVAKVWLPGSEWNDELFYFKQVEGMVHYGFPQGYFGFNESHALKFSFAAWSPVLVFPWVLWGKLFGWNLLSPILCNLVLLSLTMGLFVVFVQPSIKQESILFLLFCLFTPFVRYLLSGMPEIICFSLVILFYAVAIWEIREDRTGKLVFLLFLGILMTWMRPYLILFLFLPCFLWVRKRKWKGLLGSLVALGIALAGYAWIKHRLAAEYFADLFFTDWITAFFERGLFGGIRYTLGKLYYMGREFGIHLLEGCRSGMASGAFFAGFLTMLAVFFVQALHDFRSLRRAGCFQGSRERGETEGIAAPVPRELFFTEVHFLISMTGMLFALLLMYKLTEGSKHLLTFIAAGIFLVSLMEAKYFWKPILLGVVFLYFYWVMARSPYDYQVPFEDAARAGQMEGWRVCLKEQVELRADGVPNYDNVVIWVLSDTVEDGERRNSLWQLLYALPEGMGISCCTDEYILEHDGRLKSKYLATVSGGSIDLLLSGKGCPELKRDGDMVLFLLR